MRTDQVTLRTANWDYARDRAMLLVDGCYDTMCSGYSNSTPTYRLLTKQPVHRHSLSLDALHGAHSNATSFGTDQVHSHPKELRRSCLHFLHFLIRPLHRFLFLHPLLRHNRQFLRPPLPLSLTEGPAKRCVRSSTQEASSLP